MPKPIRIIAVTLTVAIALNVSAAPQRESRAAKVVRFLVTAFSKVSPPLPAPAPQPSPDEETTTTDKTTRDAAKRPQ